MPWFLKDKAMNVQAPSAKFLRVRMIEDMIACALGRPSQRSHLRAGTRLAAWLGRSPETAAPDEAKRFQQHLLEAGLTITKRDQTMTGVKFLFQVGCGGTIWSNRRSAISTLSRGSSASNRRRAQRTTM